MPFGFPLVCHLHKNAVIQITNQLITSSVVSMANDAIFQLPNQSPFCPSRLCRKQRFCANPRKPVGTKQAFDLHVESTIMFKIMTPEMQVTHHAAVLHETLLLPHNIRAAFTRPVEHVLFDRVTTTNTSTSRTTIEYMMVHTATDVVL